MNNLNYKSIINDVLRFKRSGGSSKDPFDMPRLNYFKLVFDFGDNGLLGIDNMYTNTSSPILNGLSQEVKDGLGSNGGALIDKGNISMDVHGTLNKGLVEKDAGYMGEQNMENLTKIGRGLSNTAYNYLLLNNELVRARSLVRFCELLSNVNAECPWYWQEVSGLGEILERQNLTFFEGFKVDGAKKITLKCLPDAYDTRIGTLIDLYREIVFNWQQKKVMLPVNLRKFNMGILVYSTPIRSIHMGRVTPKTKFKIMGGDDYNYATLARGENGKYLTSYKYFYLKGCELSPNHLGDIVTMKNDEGFEQMYEFEISVDDVFEVRYNENLNQMIGDFIETDLNASFVSSLTPSSSNSLTSRIGSEDGWGTKFTNQIKEGLAEIPESIGENIVLGNLLTRNNMALVNDVQRIKDGNLIGATKSIVKNAVGSGKKISNTVSTRTNSKNPQEMGKISGYEKKNIEKKLENSLSTKALQNL